jgi:hypothetical protein
MRNNRVLDLSHSFQYLRKMRHSPALAAMRVKLLLEPL